MIQASEAAYAIRAKVDRARHHLEQLDTEMTSFTDRHPYAIRLKEQPRPEEWVYALFLTEPIPVMWGVILGEAVHDLRSALEHVVFQLAFDNKQGVEQQGTGFPIFDSQASWDSNGGSSNIKHLGTESQAFIRSVQPYAPCTDGRRHLWALQKMWNQDKHQLVHPWGILFLPDRSSLHIDPAPVEIIYNEGLIKHGAEAFRLIYTADPLQVGVKGYLPINIGTEQAKITPGPGPVSDSLWATFDYATGIVRLLLSMLEFQETPLW